MKLRQVPTVVAVLPFVAPWAPMVLVAVAGLLLVGFAGADEGLVFRLRLSGASVAAATAWLLDDPAAVTLASSPTPLVARRGIRIAVAMAFATVWWAAAVVVAEVGAGDVPASALLREVVVLTALAALGSTAAQRWSSDGRGGSAGAFVATWWFGMSFLPRAGGLPLPPPPLQSGTTGPLLAAAAAALGLTLLLSRDPAGRVRSSVRSAPSR